MADGYRDNTNFDCIAVVTLLKSRWWNATFLPLPFLPFPSSILFPPFPFHPSHPLRSRQAPSSQWFWASAVISLSGICRGAPAEMVFGAFKP